MPALSLSLFGGFTGEYDGKALNRFRTRAVQALLVYLVCEPGPHPRDVLMTLLWPDSPLRSAQANLRHTLYHLRHTIGEVNTVSGEPAPFVLADRQTIQINSACRFRLDVVEFTELTTAQATSADLERAISLYEDDFLVNFYLTDALDFESWIETRRVVLRRRFLNALGRLTDHYINSEALSPAEKSARHQLRIDNLREEAHRQLMTILALGGRRAAALAHYQKMRRLLWENLEIEPSAETNAVVAAIRSENRPATVKKEGTELPSEHSPPHNLVPPATPFIGRQAELETLEAFITGETTRLITITGPGGIGKTRLGLAVAERQLAQKRFPNGVFFVSLTGLHDAERIVSALATALNLRLERGEEQLHSVLQNKQMLLILDNMEKFAGSGGVVTRLLAAAPHLTVMITAREPFQLQREQLLPLSGLPAAEENEKNDALQLFLQGARRVKPDFRWTTRSDAALREICQLVEGMPLALELAASWVNVLTPAEIAAEIKRNLAFLSTDLRDLPQRHRSMQAVFEGTWDSLTPESQQLLVQTTIFSGGFTREAFAAVTNSSLRDLAGLVNKSVLAFAERDRRYNMHELLGQFVSQRQQEPEATALKNRHSEYFCNWLTAQMGLIHGPEQSRTVRRISADAENIHDAILHAMRQRDWPTVDAALKVLSEFHIAGSKFQEATPFYRQLHDYLNARPGMAPMTLFWVSLWLAQFYSILSRTSMGDVYFKQAKSILAAETGQQQQTAAARAILLAQEGYLKLYRDPENAVELMRQSLALMEARDMQVWSARTGLGLARAARNAGDLELANTSVRRSLAHAVALRDQRIELEARLLLGQLTSIGGESEEAEIQLQESIGRLREINQPNLLGLGLMYLCRVQMAQSHFKKALQTATECRQVNREWGSILLENGAVQMQGMLWLHLGDSAQCKRVVQERLQAGRSSPGIPGDSGPLSNIRGLLALKERNWEEAIDQLGTNDAQFRDFLVDPALGMAVALAGDDAGARELIQQSIRRAVAKRDPQRVAIALTAEALRCAIRGDAEQALKLLVLAQRNPLIANSLWFAEVVGDRVAAAAEKLTRDAADAVVAQSEDMDLWETAAALM